MGLGNITNLAEDSWTDRFEVHHGTIEIRMVFTNRTYERRTGVREGKIAGACNLMKTCGGGNLMPSQSSAVRTYTRQRYWRVEDPSGSDTH